MDLFEVKVKYQSIGAEKPTKHSETYIIEAFNYTDAEAKMNEIASTYGFINAEIKGMKPVKFIDIFENKTASDGFWYVVKVECITLQEDGSEKRAKVAVLINAENVVSASKRAIEEFSTSDCESVSVQKTNIVEVIRK